MASIVVSNVGASMSAATGRPGQGHVTYAVNQGAFWCAYLTSTQSLSAAYSTNNGGAWTAPTNSPITLAKAHSSEGRNFGFAYANLSSTDILYCFNTYGNSSYAMRTTLGTTWTTTNTETQIGSNGGTSSSPSGAGGCLDASGFPCMIGADFQGNIGAAASVIGSNADSGSSWTFGFGSVHNFSLASNAQVLIPLGTPDNVLAIASSGTTTWTLLKWSLWNGTSWSTSANLNTAVTATDPNAWSAVARTTSDVHVVLLSNNSNAYAHYRFNGTSWSAGNTIPTLAYGTVSGIYLASDGTSVWAFVFDTSQNLQYTQWTSGGGWSAWTVLEATRSNPPAYLTGCYGSTPGGILLAWTENTGANYNILNSFLSTSGGGGSVSLSGAGGVFVLAGGAATTNCNLGSAGGTFAISGGSATSTVGLGGAAGFYSLSGGTATSNLALPGGGGTFTLAGGTATTNLAMGGGGGVFAIVGGSASLVTGMILAGAGGVFSISGGGASSATQMGGDGGIFSLVGGSATFTAGLILVGASGVFSISGGPASSNIQAIGGGGTFSVAGGSATFTAGVILVGSGGVFSISGNPASSALAAGGDGGVYAIVGSPATSGISQVGSPGVFSFVGSAATSTIALDGLPGAFSLLGSTATFVNSGDIVTATPIGSTDPAAARLVRGGIPDPSIFETDPDAATLVVVAMANPALFETDPDAAVVIL